MSGELPIRGWRLWYSDGSTFSSFDGTWEEAPSNDVQVLEILQKPKPYRTLNYGIDEYKLPNNDLVKLGAWMQEDAFYALIKKVLEAVD